MLLAPGLQVPPISSRIFTRTRSLRTVVSRERRRSRWLSMLAVVGQEKYTWPRGISVGMEEVLGKGVGGFGFAGGERSEGGGDGRDGGFEVEIAAEF